MKRNQNTPTKKEADRLKRNERARERHWRNTGVSTDTVKWMKENSFL